MPSSNFAMRTGGLLATALLAGMLTACAAEPPLTFTAPTMAPEQSLIEACSVSGAQVEQLTAETEQQVRQGIEDAAAKLAGGEMPSIEVLTGPLEQALSEIESQVTNSEVLAAVGSVRDAMQGFQDITAPESAFGMPGYLAELGAQVNALTEASKQLQTLCNAG